MLTERHLELITWLIAVVPEEYLPPSVRKAQVDLKCGSLDCLQDILEAYLDDSHSFGYEFQTMSREEILAYADKDKGNDKLA